MTELYKVWNNLNPNSSILDEGTDVFFLRLTHDMRIGILKLYHTLERNTENQKKRLKIKLIPTEGKEVRKPTSQKLHYFKGITAVKNYQENLLSTVSSKFTQEKYNLAVLIKIPSVEKYYIISMKSIGELEGMVLLTKIFNLDTNEVIVRVEDIFSNKIEVPDIELKKEEIEEETG